MSSAGATPKEITSTSESSSAPNRVPVFESRATRPSSMSRMPENTMNQPAQRKLPLKAETIAQNPKNRLPSVNALGITTTTCRIVGRRRGRSRRGISSIRPPPSRPPAWCRPTCDQHAGAQREEEVHPRAEPDHAHPLALLHRRADLVVGHDAPRDEPGDLPDRAPCRAPSRARPTTARSRGSPSPRRRGRTCRGCSAGRRRCRRPDTGSRDSRTRS